MERIMVTRQGWDGETVQVGGIEFVSAESEGRIQYGSNGERASSLDILIGCAESYGFDRDEAQKIVEEMVELAGQHLEEAAEMAGMRPDQCSGVLHPGVWSGHTLPTFKTGSIYDYGKEG